jgi:GT2 family glycosyltransferase
VVRVYHVPARWFLDLAIERGLRVLIDIPWSKHVCFLDNPAHRDEAIEAVRRAVYACARHPAVFAFSVANEIPPDVVRWSGAGPVTRFIDQLILEAKRVDPDCLCAYTNFPPTEFLQPQNADFVCFNVYLHNEQPFRNYLARLQMIADAKPLVLGEIGMDSIREGEDRKSEILSWQIEDVFREGAAGVVVFGFTDDWHRGGEQVLDWAMGLTSRDREPKKSFDAVKRQFHAAPFFPLPACPKISVVVAAYNAGRTLRFCLESLRLLRYPDYEVIVVDDGSTDSTAEIAQAYPFARLIRHPRNLGLSAARNTGIADAAGEIVTFTDADCRADPDWLYYLASVLVRGEHAAVGGPNLLPPEDSAFATAVMLSPGGPAHVMLSDRQAEHIPGCNMAFFKWALTDVGCFDPVFTKAGDDVDVCWRLNACGHKIGFSPAAVVWHYRRSTAGAYLRQQMGYGEAEAMLVRKHPEYFSALGGSIWRGRIYSASQRGLRLRRAVIYRGLFGSAGFQSVYTVESNSSLMFFTTLEYHLLVTLPLWILSITFRPLLPLAITSALFSMLVCAAAGAQAQPPPRKRFWWSRPLIAVMFLLQPMARGWARYYGRLTLHKTGGNHETLDSLALRRSKARLDEAVYASSGYVDRLRVLEKLVERLDQQSWPNKPDIGWSEYDVEVYGSRWANVQIITVAEEHYKSQLLKFRLKPRWSLSARTAFGSLLAANLLLVGLLARAHPAIWLALLTLPAFALFARGKTRALQSMLIVFLDKLAEEMRLVKPGKTDRS